MQTLAEEGVLIGDRGHYRLTHHAPTLHLPTTVQGVLAARIDRLTPDEKALLQQLAVIGREFPVSLIRQVIAQPEDELYLLLASLQHKEFLYEQPAFPEVEYHFKHALTQEVAYNSVLLERRKTWHERTAQAIEGLSKANLEEHYSELAHHYSRSGNTEKAIEYLHLAGQQAVRHSANAEAITHLTTALELLQTLPDTPERARQELTLQIALGPALIANRGFAAPEVEQTYTRARQLCQQVGDAPQLFPVLIGLFRFYLVRAELQTAHELGTQCLSLAQRVQDPALLLDAHRSLAPFLAARGDLVSAREHAERGIALYDAQQHRSHAFLYVLDPGVVCFSIGAWALWVLGYPDQALKRSHEALTLARELSHPLSLAFALTFAALFRQLRREGGLAREQAEALRTLSTEQGFPQWLAMGTILWGWALAEQGEEGITHIRQGLAAHRATGAELQRPYFLTLLAETYGKGGQAEEGLSVLAEALAQMDRTGDGWYAVELYRLKGELALIQSRGQGPKSKVDNPQSAFRLPPPSGGNPQSEAEVCFHKAIEIAYGQSAKSLELRAVMSLARLWQQQGKKEEARQMLAEIYGWFTEGFDTQDLQEAQALLSELARSI